MNAVGINNGLVVMVAPATEAHEASAAITVPVDTVVVDPSDKFKVGDAYTLLKWQEYNLSPADYAYIIAPKEAILDELMLNLTSEELTGLTDALAAINATNDTTNQNLMSLKAYFSDTAKVVSLESWLMIGSSCEPRLGAVPNIFKTIDYRAAFMRHIAPA